MVQEMSSIEPSSNFTGRLLIAMPGMSDPRFEHAVIFLCSHSEDGSMGLMINKPSNELTFEDLSDQLSIKARSEIANDPVHFGGPVEHGRGFVLHTNDYQVEPGTLEIGTDFAMTATLDVLEDMANGEGPEKTLLTLGYSGWGPGQLESEIQQNGWLLGDATRALVFDLPSPAKWTASLKAIGIDPLSLSASAGRA